MVTCAVRHCPNNVRNACGRIRFFRFPSDHRRRKLWTEFCDRETPWTPNHNSRVCSDHFDEYQYETRRQDGRKKLSPFAIPTVYSKQIDVCEDFVNENVVEDVIKEEKNVLGMTLEFVSCEDFMYHQCVVWITTIVKCGGTIPRQQSRVKQFF
ncbi:peroxynitrite isomerase THAP4 isoform X4 [Zophobas morio]|uniref:peroxynitrite isomerase THAP4 isoform X4 n=1 Tax=Zophobas morio TaxID=2755281 RepID=UPI003083B0F4